MRNLLLLLFIPFLFISCDKKDIEEIELNPEITWELHQEFKHYFRYAANLHSTDDRLYVLGLKNFSTISFTGSGEKVEHAYQYFTNMANFKFPLNSKVFVEAADQGLHFKLSENPLITISNLYINPKDIDPHFWKFHFTMSNKIEATALSDNNVALVPYYAYDAEKGQYLGSRLLLVKLILDKGDFLVERILLKEAKILDLNSSGNDGLGNNGVTFQHIKSFNNYFYVQTVKGLLRISEEGIIEPVLSNPYVYDIFTHNGNLYTIAFNNQKTALYKSSNGDNWAHIADLMDSVRELTFYPISDNILVAVYLSQLFEVNLEQLSIKELDNTGLEGHYITAIRQVNGKVFVATQSGLFNKDVEHLLTYKENAK